jgi:hypothetical protein
MKNLHWAYSKKKYGFPFENCCHLKSDVESEILLEILKYYTQANIYTNHSCVISMTNEESKIT